MSAPNPIAIKVGAERAAAWDAVAERTGYTRHSLVIAIADAAAGLDRLGPEVRKALRQHRGEPTQFEDPRGHSGPIMLKPRTREQLDAWRAAADAANLTRQAWIVAVVDAAMGLSHLPAQLRKVMP